MVDAKPGCHFPDPVVAEPRIIERICPYACRGIRHAQVTSRPTLAQRLAVRLGKIQGTSHLIALYGLCGSGRPAVG